MWGSPEAHDVLDSESCFHNLYVIRGNQYLALEWVNREMDRGKNMEEKRK